MRTEEKSKLVEELKALKPDYALDDMAHPSDKSYYGGVMGGFDLALHKLEEILLQYTDIPELQK